MNRLSWRPTIENVVSLLVVGASALFVFLSLHPSKLLTNTTATGGDMGAHVWAPDYLRHHLFVHGRITGWSPDWYGGFPALTFYFPLPYLVITVLGYVLPHGVAFKLVSVSGLVGLPVAVWAFGKLTRMRFPGPALLAVATVPFLFDRYFTIWGGNIASTLAGEFAFSISLCLAFVFLGVFSRCLESGRHRGLAAVLLAATALCHLLPTMFAVVGAALLFLMQPGRRRFARGLTVALLAGAIAAFWLLPFAFRLPYSNDMGWERTVEYLKNLFPWLNHASDAHPEYSRHLKVVVALAAAGALGGLFLRRRAALLIVGLGLAAAAAFRLMPQGLLWNARMLPFWYLCLYLAAAAGVAEAANAVGILFGRSVYRVQTAPISPFDQLAYPFDAHEAPAAAELTEAPADIVSNRVAGIVAPLMAAVVVLIFVWPTLGAPRWLPSLAKPNDQNFVSGWANWNYSGYEHKASYPEYLDVINTMKRVGATQGCGRAMWEYNYDDQNALGTPMALMLLPKWTNGCIGSMEGLYFESSATVPYHFLNQSELSKSPSDPMRHLPYRGLNVADGIAHLRLLGVRYYLALTPEVQDKVMVTPGVHLIDTASRAHPVTSTDAKTEQRQWQVFQIDDSDPVVSMSYQPAVMKHPPSSAKDWIKATVPWYQDSSRWDVPLTASGPSEWARVKASDPNPPRVPVTRTVVSNIHMTDDRITFDVDQPGSPVLVKTSYFPNWQASGARGPWRSMPNSMVVIPTSHHVELHYGFTPVDNAGRLLTVAGLAVAGAFALRDRSVPTDEDGPAPGPPDALSEALVDDDRAKYLLPT